MDPTTCALASALDGNLTTGTHNILIGSHAGEDLTVESYQIHITDWDLARDIFHVGTRLCAGVSMYKTSEAEVRQALKDGEEELVQGAMKLLKIVGAWPTAEVGGPVAPMTPMTGKLVVH